MNNQSIIFFSGLNIPTRQSRAPASGAGLHVHLCLKAYLLIMAEPCEGRGHISVVCKRLILSYFL